MDGDIKILSSEVNLALKEIKPELKTVTGTYNFQTIYGYMQQQSFDINELKLELKEARELNREMHVQVSGYLKGDEWTHWQKFNETRFKI